MRFLPAEHLCYNTSLNKEEVVKRLNTLLTPPPNASKRIWASLFSSAPYRGHIEDDTFVISRVIRYRNAFRPRISGSIREEVHGTTIEIKMRLHAAVIVFVCVWSTGVGIAGIVALTDNNAVAFIPAAMLLFLYLMTMMCFKYESRRAINDLQQLWEATILPLG